MPADYDYDIAFSFAGEDRHVVEPIAKRLKQQNVSVFYDRDKQSAIWGENLQEYLTQVYLRQARFCVMFISQAYAEKMWTRHERRAAMARAMQEKRAYILPIRLDRTELEGLLPTVAYINFGNYTEEEIVGMILEKLDFSKLETPQSAMSPVSLDIRMPRVKKTFSQREKDVFVRNAFETIEAFFQEALRRLEQHDADVKTDFDSVHRSKFLCRVYVKDEPANVCKIWLGGGWGHQSSAESICYQEGNDVRRDRDDHTNDVLTVGTDGHQLRLESGYGFGGFVGGPGPGNEERFFSPQRAAQILWERFTEPLSAD
jgi:hypothetical protein